MKLLLNPYFWALHSAIFAFAAAHGPQYDAFLNDLSLQSRQNEGVKKGPNVLFIMSDDQGEHLSWGHCEVLILNFAMKICL